MKTFALFFIALILGLIRCLAAAPGSVSGRATDDRGNGLGYATVVLLRDGEQAAGTAADREGRFELRAPEGDYLLSVQSLGFETQQRTVQLADHPLELGDIALRSSATQIEGVVVQAQLVRREADRFVVDVANSPSAIGKNGVELLERAPGVWISGDRITVDGKSGSKVFIGDRELRMEPKQLLAYLRSLHASEIQKIEVIPTAGADFDADSSGGILKITLRKRSRNGMQGSVSFETRQGGLQHLYHPSGNLSCRMGRVDLNLSAWGALGRSRSLSDERTRYAEGGKRLTAGSETIDRTCDGGGTVGIVYEPSDRNSIGAEFSLLLADDPKRTRSHTEMTADRAVTMRSLYDSYEEADGYEASFNYIRRIDTLGSTFKVLGGYLRRTTLLGSGNTSRIAPPPPAAAADSVYRNDTRSIYELASVSLALDKRFSRRWSLRAGAKYTRNRMENAAAYAYLKAGEWLRDEAQSFDMDYTEHIAALYGIASADLGRWKFTAGLRGEYTHTSGREGARQRYVSLFPHADLACDLSADGAYSLAVRYARTIGRPRFWYLTPGRRQLSDYTYQIGNPALGPSYRSDLSVTLVLGSRYTLTGGIIRESGAINQTIRPDADNPDMLGAVWVNFDATTSYCLSARLPLRPTRWWQLDADAHCIRRGERTDRSEPVRYQNMAFVRAASAFTLPAKFQIDLSYFYQSAATFGNCRVEPQHRLDAGVKKRFGEHVALSVAVHGLTNGVQTVKAFGPGFRRTVEMRHNGVGRCLVLGISYDFKTGKSFDKKSVEAGAAEEKRRM